MEIIFYCNVYYCHVTVSGNFSHVLEKHRYNILTGHFVCQIVYKAVLFLLDGSYLETSSKNEWKKEELLLNLWEL